MLRVDPRDKTQLIDPLFRAGPGFWITVAVLLVVIGWGAFMYVRQLVFGLTTTGLQRPVYWGIYMVNFIFLIGVSMAGTLVSAALHLTGVNWRRPITRVAETVTVFGLLIAGLQVIMDMGRPDRMLLMFLYGRLQSPLLWDVASLSTYILASMFALYISLLPDLGILRDNYPVDGPAWRRYLYTILALGWRGNREQWRRLEKVIRATSIAIIPIGVSLHTVTSWILSTTVQPGWHSTILGPYFVVGAIFSGIALLFLLIIALRQVYGLSYYISPVLYRGLGWFLVVMSITWFYFTYTEHLTQVAGQQEAEFPVLASKLWGRDAATFWGMVGLMVIAFWVLILPHFFRDSWRTASVFQPRLALTTATVSVLSFAILFVPGAKPFLINATDTLLMDVGAVPTNTELMISLVVAGLVLLAGISALGWLKRNPIAATIIASVCVVIGMWLERWNIIVPTMGHPHLIRWSSYTPTVTEWSLLAGSFALFAFLFLIFFKLFPPVSIWEVTEGRVIDHALAQIEVPMPESSTPAQRRWRVTRGRM
ncbi:MAG: polysulfide reductase NrfD [Chloroflexi bacterium]|nr:polysulfide reductase NrfD [Chloroflexota bacterium]